MKYNEIDFELLGHQNYTQSKYSENNQPEFDNHKLNQSSQDNKEIHKLESLSNDQMTRSNTFE